MPRTIVYDVPTTPFVVQPTHFEPPTSIQPAQMNALSPNDVYFRTGANLFYGRSAAPQYLPVQNRVGQLGGLGAFLFGGIMSLIFVAPFVWTSTGRHLAYTTSSRVYHRARSEYHKRRKH